LYNLFAVKVVYWGEKRDRTTHIPCWFPLPGLLYTCSYFLPSMLLPPWRLRQMLHSTYVCPHHFHEYSTTYPVILALVLSFFFSRYPIALKRFTMQPLDNRVPICNAARPPLTQSGLTAMPVAHATSSHWYHERPSQLAYIGELNRQ
jgi:hypothetical protein